MPTVCATFSDSAAATMAARDLRRRLGARDVHLYCPPPGHAGAVAPDLAARADAADDALMTFSAVMHDVEGACLLSARVPAAALADARAALARHGAAEVWAL